MENLKIEQFCVRYLVQVAGNFLNVKVMENFPKTKQMESNPENLEEIGIEPVFHVNRLCQPATIGSLCREYYYSWKSPGGYIIYAYFSCDNPIRFLPSTSSNWSPAARRPSCRTNTEVKLTYKIYRHHS